MTYEKPSSTEIWDLVHTERRALIADLATLDASNWAEPSLCAGWTIHDVAAHLVDNGRTGVKETLDFLVRTIATRGDFDGVNDRSMRQHRGANPAETLDRLRAVAAARKAPPGLIAPLPSRLVEEIVHGEDIRHPLSIEHIYPDRAAFVALRYLVATSTAIGGAQQHTEGVRLVAELGDSTESHGTGPEVRGPALALLMTLAGRPGYADALSGDGLPLLRQRLAA